jgi:hypothetical protein
MTYFWVWCTHIDLKNRLRPYIIGMRTNKDDAWRLAFSIKDADGKVTELDTKNHVEAVRAIKGEILELTKDLDVASTRFSNKLSEDKMNG